MKMNEAQFRRTDQNRARRKKTYCQEKQKKEVHLLEVACPCYGCKVTHSACIKIGRPCINLEVFLKVPVDTPVMP